MKNRTVTIAVFSLVVFLAAPAALFAHCDGLDGPVVTAARKALETGNINLVLPWVQKTSEEEIKVAFEKAVKVRKANKEAQELADMYFFETLVRVHRTGEGASYTGLKPAGRDLGPAIPAGDKAIESGSVEALLGLLTKAVRKGVQEHFHRAAEKSNYSQDDVEAGRAYVKAYVEYIHYVERLHAAATGAETGHPDETGPVSAHEGHQ